MICTGNRCLSKIVEGVSWQQASEEVDFSFLGPMWEKLWRSRSTNIPFPEVFPSKNKETNFEPQQNHETKHKHVLL